MDIDTKAIKQLREMTSAGISDCKNALEEAKGDIEKASKLLREKGIVKAVKKMGREAKEGSIFSYIHHNGKIGVMLELSCETDFVARNDLFKELGKNIAIHIAASSPSYVSPDEIPTQEIEEERDIQRKSLLQEGKPENIVDKIVDGKIKKFFSEISLLEQPYVKDPKTTIRQLVKEAISKLGENITIGRFERYSI